MVQKILVMRYRFIGDTILTVPFLRNLRYAYPDAQIDMLVAPMSGETVEECPYVDNFIYFDTTKKHRYENGKGRKKSFWDYVRILKSEKYDKVYVLKRSFSSAFLAFMAGIKERVGFDTECRGFMLTKRVPYVEDKHEIECFLDVLRAEGHEIKDNHLEAWTTEKEEKKVKEVFEKYSLNNSEYKKVIVHATSGNHKKEWSKEKWAEIIKWLSNEKQVQVLFNGAKGDKSNYEEIMSFIKENELLRIKPVNLCGEFSIKESLEFTKQCDFLVGCDSGNLHIAAAVGLPVVGIYGPMNTIKWHPWVKNHAVVKANIPCQPCGLKKKKCKMNYKCISDITVEQVKSAVETQFML